MKHQKENEESDPGERSKGSRTFRLLHLLSLIAFSVLTAVAAGDRFTAKEIICEQISSGFAELGDSEILLFCQVCIFYPRRVGFEPGTQRKKVVVAKAAETLVYSAKVALD